MKHIFRYLPHILATALLCTAVVAWAEEPPKDYLIVDDLPFIGASTDPGLSGYLSALFKLGIAIAVILAIVMLVINGIQYMFSDIPGIKSSAKNNLGNIVWGLILAFGSWLILFTINPNLVEFDLVTTIDRVVNETEPPPAPPPSDAAGCTTCVPVPESLRPLLSTNCGGQQCKLDPGLIAKLERLATALDGQGLGWAITEAWPNVYRHISSCHKTTGTCIDANFRNTSVTTQAIKVFLDSAQRAGLSGTIYEVGSQAEEDRLRSEGVSRVQYNASSSGAHFHVF